MTKESYLTMYVFASHCIYCVGGCYDCAPDDGHCKKDIAFLSRNQDCLFCRGSLINCNKTYPSIIPVVMIMLLWVWPLHSEPPSYSYMGSVLAFLSLLYSNYFFLGLPRARLYACSH